MAISLGVSNVTAEADILVDYNSKNLANEEIVLLNFTDNTDINLEINKTPKGKTIALLIYRNGDTLFVPVKVLN